jgi:hypothetical protein
MAAPQEVRCLSIAGEEISSTPLMDNVPNVVGHEYTTILGYSWCLDLTADTILRMVRVDQGGKINWQRYLPVSNPGSDELFSVDALDTKIFSWGKELVSERDSSNGHDLASDIIKLFRAYCWCINFGEQTETISCWIKSERGWVHLGLGKEVEDRLRGALKC